MSSFSFKRGYLLLIASILGFAATVNAQIFYRIEGNGLTAPSYIFGTHHLAPLAVADSIAEVAQAIDSAVAVVGELDMTNPMEMGAKMQPFMLAPADSTISKLTDAETYSRMSISFAENSPVPGATLQMFDALKPMALTTMVSAAITAKEMPDYDATQQLDMYFQNVGKEKGKKIIGLETPEFQANLLFGIPITNQLKALQELLADPSKAVKEARNLNTAYLNHDLNALQAIAAQEEGDDAAFMTALVDTRNAAWLKELPEIINNGTVFIAVGALHLPGENGVLQGLRNLGYTVSPVK